MSHESPKKIYLQPIGHVDPVLIQWLQKQLASGFNFEIRVAPELPLPKLFYNERRNQYFAPPLLYHIKQNQPTDTYRILGIVDRDIYTKGLNFIFGLAELKGKACVISLARLRESFYDKKENDKLFHERVLKEALHELGHTLGFTHCDNPNCVMHFSNSLSDTDKKQAIFCEKHKRRTEERKKIED
jgi:archaemetzincin